MPPSQHTHEQVQKIDQQILDLLEQRAKFLQDAMEDEDESGMTDFTNDILTEWEAAADERGWNIGLALKACRILNDLCRSGGE